jgi:hypothetical protein
MVLGIIVYSNHKEQKGMEAFVAELFAVVHVLITSRFLNEKGRKYRPFFLVSALALCSVIVIESYYICGHIES